MLSELQGEERHWLFTVTANLFTPPTQASLLVSQTRTPELFIRTRWTCANGSVEETGRGPCGVEKGSLHSLLDQELGKRDSWRARKLWGSHKVCELIHHVMGTDPYSNQLVSPTD